MPVNVEEIKALLGAVEEHVSECRAAIDVAAEGDPSALEDLNREVDAMAEKIAALKAASSGVGF